MASLRALTSARQAVLAGVVAVGVAGAQPAMAQIPQSLVLPAPLSAPRGSSEPLTVETVPLIEVPYQQTLTVQLPGAQRVLSVNPDLMTARLVAPGVIELYALMFGSTFLHVWFPDGRRSMAIQVVQPVIERPTAAQQQEAAARRAKHLTFVYQNRFRTLRRGPSLSDTDQTTTTQFDHDLTGQMDTPFGHLSGRALFQRIDSNAGLSSWGAALIDGTLGPLQHFDMLAGDLTAGASDLSLPRTTLRGAQVRYYGREPYTAELFHGRRRFGFSTGLAPGIDSDDDVFMTGLRLFDDEDPWRWGAAFVTASGKDRDDIQTSQALEGNIWYWPTEAMGLGLEAGVTQDHAFGYRLKSVLTTGPMHVDTTYRNFSQRYENLLGRTADQGEQGILVNARYRLSPTVRVRQRLDVYEDALFRNPAEPETLNMDLELGADIDVTDTTLWHSTYRRQRLLGRLFPTDTTTATVGLRQRLGAWPLLRHGSLFGQYQLRELRSVNSPSSDFKSHTARLGLGASLTDHLSWQASQQWTFLEERLSGAESVPRETSVGLNYYRRFESLPMTVRSGLHFSTTANAGSTGSFLANEDRIIWNAGLQYDVSPDTHAFIDSRLQRRDRATGREYEVELQAGVRYFFDTGIHWEPGTTVSGIVYRDMNRDGVFQSDEPGLAGVTVVARRGAAPGAAPIREALTDSQGRFYLGRLRGTSADIAVALTSLPSGSVATSPPSVQVEPAHPQAMPLTFGFTSEAELRVRVFIDVNDDGVSDAIDAPLEEIHVSLGDGTTAVTDPSGWAFFRALDPGAYTVTLRLGDLTSGYIPSTLLSRDVDLAAGDTAIVDFPIRAQRSIGGRVYVDRNRNARYDAEPVLSGIPVCLDGAQRVATQADGRYLFKGVTGGAHRVELNCGETLSGYLPLNKTMQAVELEPQPTQLDAVDFRVAEEAAFMQDVIVDVLRARRTQQQRQEAMEHTLKRTAPPTPRGIEPAVTSEHDVVIDIIVEVKP